MIIKEIKEVAEFFEYVSITKDTKSRILDELDVYIQEISLYRRYSQKDLDTITNSIENILNILL